jgi:hypothetical protein
VIVKTNFTVLDSKPLVGGFVKTFNIEKEVVYPLGDTYIEYFQLPDNAVVYSAILEITDTYKYENKTAGAQASYHYSQIISWPCDPQGSNCNSEGILSSNFFSQQGVVEIPERSFITNAEITKNEVEGTMTVFVNGLSNPHVMDAVHPGANTISISIQPKFYSAPQTPNQNYAANLAVGDATLKIEYYAPASKAVQPGDIMSIQANAGPIHSPYAVQDISGYIKGGENAISFYNIQGTFKYKLVVTYA